MMNAQIQQKFFRAFSLAAIGWAFIVYGMLSARAETVTLNVVLESQHSYPTGGGTHFLKVQGAKRLRLHFSKIGLDGLGDELRVLDGDRKVHQSYSQKALLNTWTSDIEGDHCELQIKDDGGSQGYGFRVDQLMVEF